MEFGISFLPDASPETRSAREWFSDALALSELADQSGLDSVKMTEHYLHPYGGYCPSPLGFLAAVAARTTRVRLITGCVLPVFHHPLMLASEAAMVDAISGGRLEVGFARAYLPYEFDAFGVSLDESRERYEASIHAIVKLWTERDVTIETPFFHLRNATCLPRPVQSPHPPIWGAAVKSRQSFAWLGEQGMSLLVTLSFTPLDKLRTFIDVYRESFRAAHPGREPRVALSLPLYLAESDAEAAREGDHYLQRYLDVWRSAAEAWNNTTSRDYPGYTGMAHFLKAQSPKSIREARNAIMGCPERAVEQLLALREALGAECFLWQIDYGAMPLEKSRRTLALFAERVLPRL